ncbi:MAG TPA: exonuclease domain-containing protein [Drouetiella sp.]
MNTLNTERVSFVDAYHDLLDIEFVSFDTETTGLSPIAARLVELSGVKFKLGDDRVETFSALIDPECEIPPEASAVHGITQAMVTGCPTFAEVVPQFFSWINNERAVLVAHNAPFDIGFLRVAIAKLKMNMPTHYVIDTLSLSRQLLNDAPNHQLGTLVQFLELEEGGYHRALADSHHVRNVLAKLTKTQETLKHWKDFCDLYSVLKFDDEGEVEFQVPEFVQEALDLINLAIDDDSAVAFRYNGLGRERKVKPQAVIQNRGIHYLTAYCFHFAAERTFRLDRMSKLRRFE